MKRIFVSHAKQDSQLAKKLVNDLRNVGHDVVIDVGEVSFGDDIINFMNEGLGLADVILIVYSSYSTAATWQRAEVNAATHMSISKSEKEVIAGVHVKTSILLNEIIESSGFRKMHSFRDPIRNRSLAPRRAGHLALIKEEVITIFQC